MIPTLKSEFRKLLTVRSTYLATAIIVVLCCMFSYFGTDKVYEMEQLTEAEMAAQQETFQEGSHEDGEPMKEVQEVIYKEPEMTNQLPKNTLLSHMQNAISLIGMIVAIVAILLMAHEFRFNTITHTLTASNSRSKVLVAKVIVTISYVVVVSLLGLGVVALATYTAVGVKDLILPAQSYDWLYVIGRLLAYSIGLSLLGLGIITLLRNLTAGIVLLFILPIVEGIAAAIMLANDIKATKFLPMAALSQVSFVGGIGEVIPYTEGDEPIGVVRALMTFTVALLIVWAVSWYLFLRRDAN